MVDHKVATQNWRRFHPDWRRSEGGWAYITEQPSRRLLTSFVTPYVATSVTSEARKIWLGIRLSFGTVGCFPQRSIASAGCFVSGCFSFGRRWCSSGHCYLSTERKKTTTKRKFDFGVQLALHIKVIGYRCVNTGIWKRPNIPSVVRHMLLHESRKSVTQWWYSIIHCYTICHLYNLLSHFTESNLVCHAKHNINR